MHRHRNLDEAGVGMRRIVQELAQPWLWPSSVSPNPSVFKRLARVIHWLSAIAAFAAMAIGVATAVNSYWNHSQSIADGLRWDQQHRPIPAKPISKHEPAPKTVGDTLREQYSMSTSDPYSNVGTAVNASTPPPGNTWEEQEDSDPRPIEIPEQPLNALIGVAFGFALMLTGRGIRYILAGE